MKKVSIIVPCYNAEKWIAQCLTSLLNQDYENTEVIFVDNESTDRSLEIAQGIKNKYDKLVISSAENIYPNCWDEARSEGFRLMTGDYVLVIGADDYLHESFVKNYMNIISKAPEKIKALQSPILGVVNNGETTTEKIKHTYKSIKQFKKLCLSRCPVNTPTVMYNTDLYKSGLLKTKPEVYGGAADYDLYCNLADNGVFIYPAPNWVGFFYRWHPDQATWSVQKESKNYDSMIQEYWRSKWQI